VQRALKRTHEKIILGSIVVNDPQSSVRTTVIADKRIAHFCDHYFLPVENKQVALLYLRVFGIFQRLAFSGLQLLLNFLEGRSESLEVLAGISLRDLFRGLDLITRADVHELCHIISAGNIDSQFIEKFGIAGLLSHAGRLREGLVAEKSVL